MSDIHWEVIDDTGTNTFYSREAAERYYEDGVSYAKEDPDYADQIKFQEVRVLRRWEADPGRRK